uniref:Fucolectin tachylectin-4 pentraxin-1 domain-containing protein n=1 Tax=Fundulus heteroclitus TaxID=8078 RepID=A0A3Q2T2G8_FUNHE
MRQVVLFHLLLFFTMYSAQNYPNVALRGKATQSQRYKGESFDFGAASNAIDGNTNPNFIDGSCSHTASQTNPWWRVDLLDSYTITHIIITNRGDCCHDRINGANIHIGNSLTLNGAANPLVLLFGFALRVSRRAVGRFTLIYISICFLVVLVSENLSLQGKATQSSLYQFGFAYNAIDGNRNNEWGKASCSHTGNDRRPWWRLDLRKTRKVFSIKIVNRVEAVEERLNKAEIRIGDSLDDDGNNNPRCAEIIVSPGKVLYEFQCNGMEGRYVNIVIPDRSEYLTLCEVEVYGSTLE